MPPAFLNDLVPVHNISIYEGVNMIQGKKGLTKD